MTATLSRLPLSKILKALLACTAVGLLSLSPCKVSFAQAEDWDDEPPQFLPGLVATYSQDSNVAVRKESSVLRNWYLERLDSRLREDQNLEVTWSGLLQIKSDGPFRFYATQNAGLKLEIDGQEIPFSVGEDETSDGKSTSLLKSEPTNIDFGRQTIRVTAKVRAPVQNGEVRLFWSGPDFQIEPLGTEYLSHRYEDRVEDEFSKGELLARAYRCAACHEFPGAEQEILSAPALTNLQDNLRPSWLVEHLRAKGDANRTAYSRKMPYFDLHSNDAAAISAALFQHSAKPLPRGATLKALQDEIETQQKRNKKQRPELLSQSGEDQQSRGAVVFASLGCLACHQTSDLGRENSTSGKLFGGGDVSKIAKKRTSQFFEHWLNNPSQVNSEHRMPQFDLSLQEKIDVAAYLSSLGVEESRNDTGAFGDSERGVGLIERHRCAACHKLPDSLTSTQPITKTRIDAQSDWNSGCLDQADAKTSLPGFDFSKSDREALRTFVSQSNEYRWDGAKLIAESNCFSCHQRDVGLGISDMLPAVAKAHPELASKLAALSPPALSGIGDKLFKAALKDAVSRRGPTMRPWLEVAMPKYKFSDAELDSIADFLIGHDRLPEHADTSIPDLFVDGKFDSAAQIAANRLVTSAGFGCQSCHAIGDMPAPKVDLKAQGTNLAMLGKRIRPSWFQRWVRDPSRIVAKMEMPGVKKAARGLLNDNLDRQLSALWHTLNQPDYKPPRSGAVRVVRSHNQVGYSEPTKVVTSVLEHSSKMYVRPLLFGLPNRHNILFDTENGSFAGWWIGDAASQHTRGKTWFWECGKFLNNGALQTISLKDAQGQIWIPNVDQQVAFVLDEINQVSQMQWSGRLLLKAAGSARNRENRIRELPITFAVLGDPGVNELVIRAIAGLQENEQLLISLPAASELDGTGTFYEGLVGVESKVRFTSNQIIKEEDDNTLILASDGTKISWELKFTTELPMESFPIPSAPEASASPWIAKSLDSVPGFEATQLPLSPFEMPISFAWGQSDSKLADRLFVGSLKGRVYELIDADEDGLHDTYVPITHEIPTPYGLNVRENGLDVLAKYALMRFQPNPSFDRENTDLQNASTASWACRVLADGWGMTNDYHDWAVGLESDPQGNYYIALPCQQDERDEVDAKYRGEALRLVPSKSKHRSYRLESISAGLRFPMGLVRTHRGELFATDNQGNYNPFNELNHLRPGKRYGFINKLENRNGFSPPFESPAINIPHPWTRSVNGICELRTPDSSPKRKVFGPFEGHLLGCEMNGQALIRMSLQKVNGQYQGGAYMFSKAPAQSTVTFEGPIVCEVSPNAEVYVGNLQDSGWGAGQNTGSIVRIRATGELPVGIAEVRATRNGFVIDFTHPVDREAVCNEDNYQIRSYRRISTPKYGGDDQDEATEKISDIQVENEKQVLLRLDRMREGFVYELTLSNFGRDFFPNQAHYTLRSIP